MSPLVKVIHIPGYTLEEKVKIAEAYLIPKQMRKNGVGAEHMLLPRSTVLRVASSYTREAGVRQLERELAAVCRHVALKVRGGGAMMLLLFNVSPYFCQPSALAWGFSHVW